MAKVTGPLHPLQVEILKLLRGRKLTIYRLAGMLNERENLIRCHVKQLLKYKLVKKLTDKKSRKSLYTLNKSKIEIKNLKDKDGFIIILKY